MPAYAGYAKQALQTADQNRALIKIDIRFDLAVD